jgi:hypothetical protein
MPACTPPADCVVTARYAQGAGPSPLLPAWLEFGLQPARAERRRGLLAGASPLLLPERASARCAARGHARGSERAPRSADFLHDREREHGALEAGPASPAALAGGVMPGDAVLARSEFLEPLDEATAALHWAALHPEFERESL